MIFALIGETWRNHQEDMTRYHDRMADFYREKRSEKRRMMLHNLFGRTVRRRGRYSSAGIKKRHPRHWTDAQGCQVIRTTP